MAQISIDIHYFAILREQRGLAAETLSTPAATAGALYQILATDHGFTLPPDRMKVAVNDQFCAMDHALTDGDTVVFVPPVAGG